MKKVTALAVCILCIVSVLTTGILARYTDTETLDEQTIGTKHFEMTVDSTAYDFSDVKLAPGDTVTRSFTVTNAGEVKMDIEAVLTNAELPVGMTASLDKDSFSAVEPGATKTITLTVAWDYGTARDDNSAMDKTFNFNVTINATQVNEANNY